MSHISAFVKNKQTKKTQEEHFIQTSFDSTEEVRRRVGVAGPRINPAAGSDVARPTFCPRDWRCW